MFYGAKIHLFFKLTKLVTAVGIITKKTPTVKPLVFFAVFSVLRHILKKPAEKN